jgi:hypothetical protein
MGERSAVERKSGESVRQSDPGLRRPTPPSTAGRKPAARPPVSTLPAPHVEPESLPRDAGITQRKTGRGVGQSPTVLAQRKALGPSVSSDFIPACELSDSELTTLIQFFQTLDRWDRELMSIGEVTQ